MENNTFNIEIVSPDSVTSIKNVISLTAPGSDGSFGILKDHAPMSAALNAGHVHLEIEDKEVESDFFIGRGVLEVENNNVVFLLDTFESSKSIDINRAELAKTRAGDRLSGKTEEKVDFLRARLALNKAISRLNISSN